MSLLMLINLTIMHVLRLSPSRSQRVVENADHLAVCPWDEPAVHITGHRDFLVAELVLDVFAQKGSCEITCWLTSVSYCRAGR